MAKSKSEELLRVAKFGGTSLAGGEMIKKAAGIVLGEDERRFVVVSAPGKRFKDDVKVTDMLYLAYDLEGDERKKVLDEIEKRFTDIVCELGVGINIPEIFEKIGQSIGAGLGRDYAASRGEYIMARIFSEYTGYEFIDAAEVIYFSIDGSFDSERTNERLKERLEGCHRAVIPGFYGSMPNDTVKTFSRGGSDITGALVARAVGADVYENFTDVDGFMMADPRIVENPKIMEQVSYSQLRELSYMGATVLHEDSIYPVRFSGIPINIRNTFDGECQGTMIVSKDDGKMPKITGIAGRKSFSAVVIGKNMSIAEDTDFYKNATSVFFEYGLCPENIPGGIDSISFLVDSERLKPVRRGLLLELCRKLKPECVHIRDNLALIALVGQSIYDGTSYVMKMLGELFDIGIKAHLIIMPPEQSNIVVGVDESDYERAVRQLYFSAVKE